MLVFKHPPLQAIRFPSLLLSLLSNSRSKQQPVVTYARLIYHLSNNAHNTRPTTHTVIHRPTTTAAKPIKLPRKRIRLYHSSVQPQHQQQQQQQQTSVVPFILPDIGEGIKEVVIKEWLIKVGDTVKEFDGLCEVESDKATVTISSRFNGSIVQIHYQAGDMAAVGKPLVDIELDSATTSSSDNTDQVDDDRPIEHHKSHPATNSNLTNEIKSGQMRPGPSGDISTLPSVRRMAAEHGIDLHQVVPTGKFNRILKEDLIAYMNNNNNKAPSRTINQLVGGDVEKEPASLQQRLQHQEQQEVRVPIKGVQRAMFKQMTKSLQVPHFNYSDEIDVTQLIEFTQQQKRDQPENRVAMFSIFVKMVSMALRDFPQLNATIDEQGECLVHKSYHNIGIAIDTKFGLVVPNIKHVQLLSIEGVHKEMQRLRDLAYASKLTPNELANGTISLSNIGAVGGLFGIPVLVTPEILIGALGQVRPVPRFNSTGSIEARQVIQVAWSADHRVVDGATLARFSNLLKHYLEQPARALLKLV